VQDLSPDLSSLWSAAMGDDASGNLITALFNDRASAEQAYRCVSELGYDQSEINVVMSAETRERYFAGASSALSEKAATSPTSESNAAKELGGPAGGTLGTAAPVVAAIGALLLVPGVGLAVAGPIAVALGAATAVGVAGGLVGALTHWGVPRGRLEEYEGGIRRGGVLLGVKPRSPADTQRITQCWQTSGGRSVHT
jgi:hypothetical protein